MSSFILNGNIYTATTAKPTSLVGQKYLLPAGSTIKGICSPNNDSGNTTKINNLSLNISEEINNTFFINYQGYATQCNGLMGKPVSIILSENLVLPNDKGLIHSPVFSKSLAFDTTNELFDVKQIQSNGYQLKILLHANEKELPSVGIMNPAKKGFITINSKLTSNGQVLIIDGIYNQILLAKDQSHWETIDIK